VLPILLELAILLLGLLHRLGLELLRIAIHADEDAPAREQQADCHDQGGGVQQQARIFVGGAERGDEALDASATTITTRKRDPSFPQPL
jgi:hypothetical protein